MTYIIILPRSSTISFSFRIVKTKKVFGKYVSTSMHRNISAIYNIITVALTQTLEVPTPLGYIRRLLHFTNNIPI